MIRARKKVICLQKNNNSMQRKPILFFLSVVLAVISGCSQNTSLVGAGADVEESQSWYECSASPTGEGWFCGDQLESPETDLTASLDQQDVAEAASDDLSDDISNDFENPGQESISKTYTLQVAAFAGEHQREQFIEDEDLPEQLFDFRMVENQGRIWWVLTHGEYQNIADARLGALRVKELYGLENSWVRSLDDFLTEASGLNDQSSIAVDTAPSSEDVAGLLPASLDGLDQKDRFRIQLAAFKTRESVDQYIEQKGLSGEIRIDFFQEKIGSESWWLVLYGTYNAYEEAARGQVYLRDNFGIEDTWVKPW